LSDDNYRIADSIITTDSKGIAAGCKSALIYGITAAKR
jgi:hypothetical protein